MNKILSVVLVFCAVVYAQSQVSFSGENIINSNDVNGPRTIYAADIDGDGDMDMVSASNQDNKIAWYENTDGLGTFGPQQLISNGAIGPNTVIAADVDGDNDLDVLSASSFDATIAWYPNTDGAGAFGAQQLISNQCQYAMWVAVADLDKDGDLDVVSASLADDKIAWYENTDGAGTFGDQQIVSTQADAALFVQVADINHDGWIDIISASMQDGKVAWYQNMNGSGFSAQNVITEQLNQPRAVACADIDKDGDTDIAVASSGDNTVSWYQNDGAGTFGAQNVIANDVTGAVSVAAVDIDKDGDQDIVACAYNTNTVMWYENTNGLGAFGQRNVITNTAQGPNHLYIADLNGDTKQDVAVACETGKKLVWYENETELSVQENVATLSCKLYPIPVADKLHIDMPKHSIQKVCVLDILGNPLQLLPCVQNTVDMSAVSPGVYLLKIYTEQQVVLKKVVKR